jgi:signal transduction histidine kinase
LRIRTKVDDDNVYLLFGDTGAGIKQEDLVKLFQPYHTTKTGGHGLGLMIVQRILREHGGQVGIESKEGVGTLVTLQFPQKNRRVKMLK